MKKTMSLIILGVAGLSLAAPLYAQSAVITNPGFETGFDGWTETDPEDGMVSLSAESTDGAKSAKIKAKSGTLQQKITLAPNTAYTLSLDVKGAGLFGIKTGGEIFYNRTNKTKAFKRQAVNFKTGAATDALVFLGYNGKEGRYDALRIDRADDNIETGVRVIAKSAGGYGLSPDLKPSQNFDLLGWTLALPTDDNRDGKADNISERDLAGGYTHSDFFYTGPDGGMVMKATNSGATTSSNTKNVRTELRGMLRRGDTSIKTRLDNGKPNKNNWVFSTAPDTAQKAAGAVDGKLEATLAVNYVSTTGKESQMGRVIIGQIHAKKDEPLRLYYRKMPGHTKGSIYVAHEPSGKKDVRFSIIGNQKDRKTEPENGIALNEVFSYEIIARGYFIDVNIIKEGAVIGSLTVDQTDSGYDVEDEYNYFKAGVYNQNHGGDPNDYVQATFYKVKTTH